MKLLIETTDYAITMDKINDLKIRHLINLLFFIVIGMES